MAIHLDAEKRAAGGNTLVGGNNLEWLMENGTLMVGKEEYSRFLEVCETLDGSN